MPISLASHYRTALKELVAGVRRYMIAADLVLTEPPTRQRGQRLAALMNDLNLACDLASRYGLHPPTMGQPRPPAPIFGRVQRAILGILQQADGATTLPVLGATAGSTQRAAKNLAAKGMIVAVSAKDQKPGSPTQWRLADPYQYDEVAADRSQAFTVRLEALMQRYAEAQLREPHLRGP
jgi:hypothetical protein